MLQGFFVPISFFVCITAGQALVFYAMNRKLHVFYRELIGAYQFICVLSAFFYYGIFDDGWLMIALMVLPLAYLLHSNVTFLGYLAVILIWAYYSEQEITWFFLLVAFAAPYILRMIGDHRYKLSGQVIAWFMAIYLIGALAVTLKDLVYSALASVLFSSYFSSLYFFDRIFYDPQSSFIFRPFSLVRTAGIIVLAQIFSFDIWGSHPELTWALLHEYITLFILIGLAFMMLKNIKKNLSTIVFGGYFLFNIISYLLTYIPHPWIRILVALLQSIYSVMTGIALTFEAQRKHNLLLHLGGTGIIALQIILRSAELGMIWALPAFIAGAIGYIIVNYSFFKRWRMKHAKKNY